MVNTTAGPFVSAPSPRKTWKASTYRKADVLSSSDLQNAQWANMVHSASSISCCDIRPINTKVNIPKSTSADRKPAVSFAALLPIA